MIESGDLIHRRFVIIGQINQGRFGMFYSANDTRTDTMVVMKVPKFREEYDLEREYNFLTQLAPYIYTPSSFEFGRTAQFSYFLHSVHQLGVCHADITLMNLCLSLTPLNCRILLIDFGDAIAYNDIAHWNDISAIFMSLELVSNHHLMLGECRVVFQNLQTMSLSKIVNIENLNTVGFLCECNDEVYIVYTLEHGLLELPNTDCVELELGQWYNVCDGELDLYEMEIKDCKVWLEDGNVLVEVMAIGPNDWLLPKKIADKYSLKVWSPLLKFLIDEDDIFNSEYMGGDVGKVVVKFAPVADGRNFEVVRIPDDKEVVQEGISYVMLTPWTLEFMAENMKPAHELWPEAPITNQYNPMPLKRSAAFGVCIAANAFNPTHHQSNSKGGSTDKVCVLFSPKYGITRWLVKPMKTISHDHDKELRAPKELQTAKVGHWFAYEIVDKRLEMKRNNYQTFNSMDIKNSAYYNCTARNVSEVEPVKATKVVNGEIEIEASFSFKRSMLVDEKGVLRTDAHFFDVDLGRVEIYPQLSKFLIDKIDDHHKMLREKHSSDYCRLKSELIVVSVTVRVHKNYYENSKKYPDNGIFTVKEATRICYMNGGYLIFDAELKK